MQHAITRREFLKHSSAFTAGVLAAASPPAVRAAASPNDKVLVAVIGCNGRGMNHITSYLNLPNVEIACVCDVDRRAIEKGLAAVAKKQARPARGEKDLRRVLEDKDLTAISIAMPEHWHAPATIMACAAGKHVYVEKPGSHNGREAELMVAAAREHKRVVQMGNQRRSWPWVIESIQALHSGEIGEVHLARGWYANKRGPIGRGMQVPVPEWLDFDLWQGPAPEENYRDNILHYNWHWFWNWGTGELGNNGVHALDLARWGLRVDLPRRVSAGGGRYFFEDDWQTPDSMTVTYDYGRTGIFWEGHSCAPRGFEGTGFGVNFYGDKGTMVLAGSDCKIYDPSNKLVREISGRQKELFSFDEVHFLNFVDGIREGKPLRAEIEDGQKSTMLCHLGNIAWRTGHTLDFDRERKQITGDEAAAALWTRKYRKGWEPRV